MTDNLPARRRWLIKLVLVHYLFFQLLLLPPQIIKLVTEKRQTDHQLELWAYNCGIRISCCFF